MNPYEPPPPYDDEDEAESPINMIGELLFVTAYCSPVVAAYLLVIVCLYPAVIAGFLLAPIVAVFTPWERWQERPWHRWWPVVPGAIIGAVFIPMWWRDGLLPSLFDFARKMQVLWGDC